MFHIDTDQIMTGAVAFLRISAIVSMLPLFGDNPTPVRVRILLGVALSIFVVPLLPSNYALGVKHSMIDVPAISSLMIREVLIGIVIGYISKLAFDGIVMAANVVGVQMGFNTSNIFLPDSPDTTNGFSALHRLLIMMVFLSLNLHHIYVSAIMDSFRIIPLGLVMPTASLTKIMVTISAGIFLTSLQLAAPILVGLLFSTAALGLISRAVPQANVFVMSFPINFFVGLFIYLATLPMLPGWIGSYFSNSQEHLFAALSSLARP